jgi:hypothetical protein
LKYYSHFCFIGLLGQCIESYQLYLSFDYAGSELPSCYGSYAEEFGICGASGALNFSSCFARVQSLML